jgi:hypothetical protein
MRNILVKSLFNIQDSNWHIKNRKNETNLYEKYVEAHQISLGSYTQHLKGKWEFKFISGTVANVNEAFQKTFYGIYKLWKEGNTTILYTDPDTLAIRDINPWEISDKFMMFNYTDPKSFNKPNQYRRTFKHFFNAGVRLFPAQMKQEIWDNALAMAQTWDTTTYDTEQIILNSMLWDQGVTLDQVLRPEWAYQAQWLPGQAPLWHQDLWNGLNINQANIIHTHSSRNLDAKLQLMKQWASK